MLVSGLTETDTSLFNRSILLLFFLDLFFPFFFRVESKSLEVRRVCEIFSFSKNNLIEFKNSNFAFSSVWNYLIGLDSCKFYFINFMKFYEVKLLCMSRK